jgi:hypothetical protein
MLRGVARPWCNVSFRLEGEEFRVDQWWGEFALAAEADGALKYSSDQATGNALWAEKLRQEWLEDELGISVFRYVDAEVRLAPDRLARRFVRKKQRRDSTLWTPPPSLEVFQRPLPGSTAPPMWLRRPNDG